MKTIYEVDLYDVADVVCDGGPKIYLYHSWRNHYGEQIDPPEYMCPLDFSPELEWETTKDGVICWCGCREYEDDNI